MHHGVLERVGGGRGNSISSRPMIAKPITMKPSMIDKTLACVRTAVASNAAARALTDGAPIERPETAAA